MLLGNSDNGERKEITLNILGEDEPLVRLFLFLKQELSAIQTANFAVGNMCNAIMMKLERNQLEMQVAQGQVQQHMELSRKLHNEAQKCEKGFLESIQRRYNAKFNKQVSDVPGTMPT